MRRESGQTLLELIVVIAVIVLVVGALVFATISSLRNARLAQNQVQATKLAQEGIEKVRSIRDRDGPVNYSGTPGATDFNGLYQNSFACPINCYFYFNSLGILSSGTSANSELITPFQRQFQIEDEGASSSGQKKITSRVTWTDFAGSHESKLTTVLRKIQ